MKEMLIFGLGYTAGRLAQKLRERGWLVASTRRVGDGESISFDNEQAVLDAIGRATHIISSVPPLRAGPDPVLEKYGKAIANAPACWTGYLSSTGVYGDTKGAWVDETAPIGHGRRVARSTADHDWQALRADMHVFRLPGIYGPERSALDRISSGKARRIDMPEQIFSRVHVDDIVSGVIASFDKAAGVYNLADDMPCPQNHVIEYGSRLLGQSPPPLQSLAEAGLSDAALAFYSENRRVSNQKAKRILGWAPQYADYRSGLNSCLETSRS